MEIKANITEAEQIATLKAICLLSELSHIKHMPHILIAASAEIKATKMRAILQHLVDNGQIRQLTVSLPEKRVARYYYLLTDTGTAFMSAYADKISE